MKPHLLFVFIPLGLVSLRGMAQSNGYTRGYYSAPAAPRATTGYTTAPASGGNSYFQADKKKPEPGPGGTGSPPETAAAPAPAVAGPAAKFAELERNVASAETTLKLAAGIAPAELTAGQRTRYYRQLFSAQVTLERYAEAAATYEDCLARYPDAARDFLHQQAIIVYYRLGRYAKGVAAAKRRSAEAGPVVPYYQLLCQAGLGQYEVVLRALLADEKEANYREYADRKYQLALCQVRSREGNEGIRYRNAQLAQHNLTTYLESPAGRQAPYDAELLLSEVYFRLRNYEACIRQATALLQRNPADTRALRQRAAGYVAEQQYPAALADQTTVLRYAAAPTSWNARAQTRFLTHDYAGMLADANASLRLDSTSAAAATAYCYRGFVWKARQLSAPALTAYNRALVVDPACSAAYLGRGLIRQAQKQLALACADFRLAVKYDTKEAPVSGGVSEATHMLYSCYEVGEALLDVRPLSAGLYSCVLVVSGRICEARRLAVTK